MKNTKNKNFTKTLIIMILVAGLLTLGMMILEQVRKNNDTYVTIDLDSMKLVQLEEPKENDPIAIVETTLGEIRFVLYPEYSPNAVKNFTELAESGYYDNTYFYNSDSGVYSSAGSKQKDGSYTQGNASERVERELSQDLWSFKGAVCCATTDFDRSFTEMLVGGGTYYCGSRLNFLNTIEFTDELKEEMRSSATSEELTEAFIEKGGIPNFSQQMTVIGQVYEGLDVVEKLASLDSTDDGNYKIPNEDIMIISVKIDAYSPNEKTE
ncbi:MAG: peptidylprolyl isomerase [Ruminococcus flavefaciens]|nr:peptidylprolyl isomerase [Ruminococcus flavefaciens]